MRIGVDLDQFSNVVFKDLDCSSTSPAALYGCGKGSDGAPYRSRGEIKPASSFQLGIGRDIGNRFRVEFVALYKPNFTFDGNANFLAADREQHVRARLSSFIGFISCFIDFHAVGDRIPGPISPYVGVGVGASRNRISQTVMTFPATSTMVPGDRHSDFAWSATAGIAIPVNDQLKLDLAWRLSDFGKVQTGQGMGSVVWRNGAREPLALNLGATQARLKGSGVSLSLRYSP